MEVQLLEQSDTLSRVALIGMLDMVAVGQIEVKFLAGTVARGKNAIVDLSQLAFIASLGMGMLVGAQKGLKRKGARLVLLNPQSDVEEALKVARITEILPLAHGEEEALQLLAVS